MVVIRNNFQWHRKLISGSTQGISLGIDLPAVFSVIKFDLRGLMGNEN